MTAPAASQARYPIRAVSKLTGLGIDTLRAWERRYGIVSPSRDGRGRLYSEADIARLRLLRDAVAAGHSIGRVASLPVEELEALVATRGAAQAPATASAPTGTLDTARLRAALETFDSVTADQELTRMATTLPPTTLVRDVILPVIRDAGNRWNADHRGSIAHEHLISATLRHLLGSFLRVYARPGAPVRMLFATPSGDRHELGILAAAMLAASQGMAVSYLGPDLPADEIAAAVRAFGAQILVLGITLTDDAHGSERELHTLMRELPEDAQLWVGGPGATHYANVLGARAQVLPDFDVYAARLQETARTRAV